MSTQPPPGGHQPTPEEYEAMLREQLDKVRIEDVIAQVAVDILNLAAHRAGLAPRAPGEEPAAPDWQQAGLGIEAVRGLLGVLDPVAGERLRPVKDALAQLQMRYVQAMRAGEAPAPAEGAAAEPAAQQPPPAKPGEAGPAQRSGRLWVPGQ